MSDQADGLRDMRAARDAGKVPAVCMDCGKVYAWRDWPASDPDRRPTHGLCPDCAKKRMDSIRK